MMSKNDPDHPFLGTSASMEVLGCVHVLNALRAQGFGSIDIKVVTDGDTTAGKMVPHLWQVYSLLACSGHMNKNLGKAILNHSTRKGGLKNIKSLCVCRNARGHRYNVSALKKRRSTTTCTPVDTTTIPPDDAVTRLTVTSIKSFFKSARSKNCWAKGRVGGKTCGKSRQGVKCTRGNKMLWMFQCQGWPEKFSVWRQHATIEKGREIRQRCGLVR